MEISPQKKKKKFFVKNGIFLKNPCTNEKKRGKIRLKFLFSPNKGVFCDEKGVFR